MTTYTVERVTPESWEIKLKIDRIITGMQFAVDEINDTVSNIRAAVPMDLQEAMGTIDKMTEFLFGITDSLYIISDELDAMETEDRRKTHLQAVQRILCTPPEDRSKLETDLLRDAGIEIEDGQTLKEIIAGYRRKLNSKPIVVERK